MTKLSKFIPTLTNTVNTFCSTQRLISSSTKWHKVAALAKKWSRLLEWLRWESLLLQSALLVVLLALVSTLLQQLRELVDMILIQMVDRLLISIQWKQPSFTMLKSIQLPLVWTNQLSHRKAWRMSRIVTTSTSKMKTRKDIAVAKSSKRLEILMFLNNCLPLAPLISAKPTTKNTSV